MSVEITQSFRVSITLELGKLNDGGEEKEGYDIPSSVLDNGENVGGAILVETKIALLVVEDDDSDVH